jgi:hypothetical protein
LIPLQRGIVREPIAGINLTTEEMVLETEKRTLWSFKALQFAHVLLWRRWPKAGGGLLIKKHTRAFHKRTFIEAEQQERQ